jgi:nitrogen fixation/metabolism regulation signal transduction histidine kinase
MKQYRLAFLSRLIPLLLCFLVTGYIVAVQWYSAALVVFVAGGWFVFSLYRFMKCPAKDAKRLVDAIQFSEFNISFRRLAREGLFPELIPQMENAVSRFNERLQETEITQQFYDLLLNRIDSAILVFDKMDAINWINKAASDEFGKPQPRRLVDLTASAPDLPGVLKKMRPGEVKMITIKKEGHTRRFAATAVVFISKGIQLKLVSFKDIQPVLEESESDAWKKLIRVLTHEMMNSITPIISLAETLSDPELTHDHDYEVMSRAMQVIHRRSKGLVEFVGNYQKLARIPAPVKQTFSAAEMMVELNHLMQADGIRFTYDIQSGEMNLFADRTLLEQALINLIKNAHEACLCRPSPAIHVQIYKNMYHHPVIVVSDNGCGILPDVQDKIFVPFFTTKAGGSGIGLSICRQIIVSHGGNITIESEPDKGTRIVLQL